MQSKGWHLAIAEKEWSQKKLWAKDKLTYVVPAVFYLWRKR